MSTRAPSMIRRVCDGIEKIYRSAVCSGIVGDARHAKRGGYHRSREDNPRGNYSIVRPDDRAGNGPDDEAPGFDISMNKRDMILATQRIKAVWANRNDPRRKYLNAVNGWLGGGEATRFDMVSRKTSRCTPDHKSHVHGEARRKYVRSGSMVIAVLSMFRGESVSTYLKSIGVKVDPPKPAGKAAAPGAPKYPGRVLKAGDNGPAVKAWQQRMIGRGWKSIGKADGDFGPKTTSVVKRFQKDCRMTADGEIGPKTWPMPWTRPLGG